MLPLWFTGSRACAHITRCQGRQFHGTGPQYFAKSGGRQRKGGYVEGFRADRVLANRGWGSRSECFDVLKKRRVFERIESGMRRIVGPSERISMEADLWIDGKTEVLKPPPLLRVYHKPKWVLSAMNDKKERKNLGDLDFASKMHPVGRLDYDSSGLLLFSSDGSLTHSLLHPVHECEKEYVAHVVGTVDKEVLGQQLSDGVKTGAGVKTAELLEAESLPKDEVQPMIQNILDTMPPEYNLSRMEEKGDLFFKDAKEISLVRLVVKEGKHRMVRRMLANSGFPVIALKRVRLGEINLDDLEEGCQRELSEKELKWAKSVKAVTQDK